MKTNKMKIPVMIALLIFGVISSAQGSTVLKISNFLPTNNFTHSVFIKPWSEQVAQCSEGELKFELFTSGSAFGNVNKQMDQVRAGVVDIAHGLTGMPRGRLPRTSIIDMPFLVKSADAASKALWDLYNDGYISDDYKGVKVLALHAHNGGLIHSREKPITDLKQLEAQRIRFPSIVVKFMLEHYGASAVGMPPTAVYQNLSKGAIDGTVFPWEAVHSFKVAEVLKYHLDAKAYTTSFFFVINQRKYKALPEKIRKCIDQYSGDVLVDQFGQWWNDADEPGYQAAVDRGNEITPVSEEQRQKWLEELKPDIDKYLESLKRKGVAKPQELYQAAKDAVAKYEK